jgi:hypothetical protein
VTSLIRLLSNGILIFYRPCCPLLMFIEYYKFYFIIGVLRTSLRGGLQSIGSIQLDRAIMFSGGISLVHRQGSLLSQAHRR